VNQTTQQTPHAIGKTGFQRGHRVCVAPMLDWTEK